MSLVDKIKNKAQSMIGAETPVVSICMMGPRAVGKTTVLTSIFTKSQETVGDSRVFMRSANDNASLLPNYKTQLEAAFEQGDPSSLPATDVESDFLFDLGILGKAATVKLSVRDFPGEYLTSNDQIKKSKVKEFVQQSHIILVAIDTPFLMEEDGRYNNDKNIPDLVIKYLTTHPEEVSNKLVMFIPLKCERYYYEKRMDEVANRVIESYGLNKDDELFKFFNQNNIASVIAPILSLGGIEFDKMVSNTNISSSIPVSPTFRMYSENPTYNPLFCSQPFYYLLTYVSHYYNWTKNQTGGFLNRLRNNLNSYLTSDSEFMSEISKMHTRIITNKFGYKVIQNNSIINL